MSVLKWELMFKFKIKQLLLIHEQSLLNFTVPACLMGCFYKKMTIIDWRLWSILKWLAVSYLALTEPNCDLYWNHAKRSLVSGIILSITMTRDFLLRQSSTASEKFHFPNLTHKAWVSSWYGFRVLYNSAARCDSFSTLVLSRSHLLGKLTVVRFENRSHGRNSKFLTTRSRAHLPYERKERNYGLFYLSPSPVDKAHYTTYDLSSVRGRREMRDMLWLSTAPVISASNFCR